MALDDEWRTSRRAAWGVLAGAAWMAGDAGAQTVSPAVSTGAGAQVLDFMPLDQRRRWQSGEPLGDCTAAFAAALASGAAIVSVPAGRFPVQPGLRVPAHVSLVGQGYGLFPGMAATALLKSGNGPALVVMGTSQVRQLSIEGLPGNQGDGILVLGGRSVVQDVSVFAQGRDGVKVGDVAAGSANTNLWRLGNLVCRQNGRHGLFIAHEGAGRAPNVNAGLLMGIDASFNGGDGVRLSEAVDNQLIGIASQSNAGTGVMLESLAKGNLLLSPYCEANKGGDIRLSPGADRNMVLGVRSDLLNSGTINQGADNVVWGRFGSVNGVPLHEAPEAFEQLEILDRSGSGLWRLRKLPDTRQLSVELAGSGKGADVLFRSDGMGSTGLRFANDEHSAALRDVRSRGVVPVVADPLPAGGQVDVAVPLMGVDARFVIIATPLFAPPSGLSWGGYWDDAARVVRLRCSNLGTVPIRLRGNFQVVALRAS